MSERIVRFSGNNLNDPLIIKSLVNILARADHRHVLVVSAPRSVQTILTQGLLPLKSPSGNPNLLIGQLKLEVNKISKGYGLKESNELSALLDKLEVLLKGIHYAGDFSPALRDQVVSFSEKTATLLLAGILQAEGINANVLYPEELGLTVSAEFGNASVQLEESVRRIQANFPDQVTLIPGSYGVTTDGKIARIGDRAADYTAAAIAAIVNADHLELWQIRTPFKTADEDFVENPAYIESLTYAEASELSYFNYSGIHPRIVEPLIDKHIPIQIYDLEGGEKILRTRINTQSIVAPQVVKSVAHTDDIAILKLNGPGVGFKPGILAKVTGAFSLNQINIRSVITAQTSINILIGKDSVKQVHRLTKELNLSSVSEFEVVEDVSLVAIVGHGMQQNHGISALLFSAVANNRINVLLSGSGASDLVSYLVVDEKDKGQAIQEIHKIFFK